MPNGQILSMSLASMKAQLLDSIVAVTPGWWIPWSPFASGSVSVSKNTATAMNATVNVLGSNANVMPGNGVTATMGGSPAEGNTVTITLYSSIFPTGKLVVTYTVGATPTTTTVATGLAAAINSALAALVVAGSTPRENANQIAQLLVTSAAAVVTIISNAVLPEWSAATAVTGGGVTSTLAAYDSGEGFILPGCSFTALGNAEFQQSCAWIKGACPTWTAGDLSVILVGNIP